jgi:hypothetical protein
MNHLRMVQHIFSFFSFHFYPGIYAVYQIHDTGIYTTLHLKALLICLENQIYNSSTRTSHLTEYICKANKLD